MNKTEEKVGMKIINKCMLCSLAILLFSDSIICAEKLIISIPTEKLIDTLHTNDRISEYTINIYHGRIYGILKIPDDWWINGKDVEQPQLKAWAFHGTGYLTKEDIKNGAFDRFLIIETEQDEGSFDLKAHFTVDVSMREKQRHLLIEKKDMIIKPVQE